MSTDLEEIDKRWSEEQTKFLLDKYGDFLEDVGPMKRFKTKAKMWEKISADMMEKDWDKSATQCENRYKTVLKQQKSLKRKNSSTGTVRQNMQYENEFQRIAGIDDSITPEIMVGVGVFERNMSPTAHKNKKAKSIATVLKEISEEKERRKDRRHEEKMNLLREIFLKNDNQ